MIREGKIDQVHIKTVVQHKVMCVPFVMAGELHMLGPIKLSLIKSEANKEEEGQQTNGYYNHEE